MNDGPDPKAVGQRIRQARLELGLDQDQLAERAGIGARSLSDYERGLRIPYLHRDRLEEALDRPWEWILHGGSLTEARQETRIARLEEALARVEAALDAVAQQRQANRDEDADDPPNARPRARQ